MNVRRRGRALAVTLWIAALAAMIAAAAYQRRTGPTYPARGSATLGEESLSYRLLRSHPVTSDAELALAAPAEVGGSLHFRRLRSDDAWSERPLERQGERLVGYLPAQPPAGKVEYYLTLERAGAWARIPAGDEAIVLRYRGEVPVAFLLPHVLLMFAGMLVGVRCGLGALLAPAGTARLARWTLAGLTAGGMILGPIVQKYAFGAYWTGWPFGGDWTDNKTLAMWLAWAMAVALLGRGERETSGLRRAAVVLATAVMLAVYLIPHSMRGSELDYRALERGAAPHEAVETGKPPGG